MGNPFFAGHNILHMGLSLLLSGYFSLAHDKIERVVADHPRVEDKELAEALAEGSVPSKLVFKLLLTIPSLLLGFKILSPILTLCISMQHDLSLRCGVIQLLVSTVVALGGLLYNTRNDETTIDLERQYNEQTIDLERQYNEQTSRLERQYNEQTSRLKEKNEEKIFAIQFKASSKQQECLDKAKEKADQHKAELQKAKADRDKTTAELNEKSQNLRTKEAQISELERQLVVANDQIARLEQQVASKDADLAVLKDAELKIANDQIKQLKQLKQENEKTICDLQHQASLKKEWLTETTHEIAYLHVQLEEITKQHEAESQKAKADRDKTIAELSEKSQNLRTVEAQSDEFERQLRQALQDRATRESEQPYVAQSESEDSHNNATFESRTVSPNDVHSVVQGSPDKIINDMSRESPGVSQFLHVPDPKKKARGRRRR